MVEAVETKSWRRDGAAAVEVVQEGREEAWLLASQVSELADGEATAAGRAWVGEDTSVEAACPHPRTTLAAEVCKVETDTLAGGHTSGGEDAGSVAAAAADGAASAVVDATAVPRNRRRRKRMAEAAAAITEGSSCPAVRWLAKAMVEAGGVAGGAEAMLVAAKAMAEDHITSMVEMLDHSTRRLRRSAHGEEIRRMIDATMMMVGWLAMVLADERASGAVVDGAAAGVENGAKEEAAPKMQASSKASSKMAAASWADLSSDVEGEAALARLRTSGRVSVARSN